MAAAGLLVLAACGGSSGKANAFKAGDTLPGYVHVAPRGSRADVQAKGRHAGGQWTVETARMLDTGRTDDTRFEVDVAKIFSLGITNNSGLIHSGASVVNLAWTGSPSASTVVAGDLDDLGTAAPVIDGDASDPAWTVAPVSTITFTPQSGDSGVTQAIVQVVWLDEFIYFRVTWSDTTADIYRKQWTFDGTNWSQNGENEDRLYLMFDVTGATGTATAGAMDGTTTPFTTMGCAMSCHGDGVMRTDSGRVDIWHWKSTRTDPMGFLDDKFMVAAAPSQDGRHSDEGSAAYLDNKDSTGTAPAYRSSRGFDANPDFLCLLPADRDFAEAKTSDSGFTANDTLPGYVGRIPFNSRGDVSTLGRFEAGDWTVEFGRALDTGNTWEWGGPARFRKDFLWQDGDTVPGYVTFPPKGSFGDVEAMGQWTTGEWVVEIGRDLDTGNPDDVIFMPFETPGEIQTPILSIGVTDNSGGTHNGAPVVDLVWFGTAGPTMIVAEPLGTSAPPNIDGDGGDAAWGGAQTSIVPLTPQSGANGITSVEVQAVRSASRIYFKFRWSDATRNEFREQWTYNTGSWSQSTENEDRLFVMFDLDGATGTATAGAEDGTTTPFTTAGCTMSCHGDGVMRTDSGQIDTWHWKATRNNGSGWLDDKHMIPAISGTNGRKADDGAALAARNRNSDQTMPNYMAFNDPGADAVHLNFVQRNAPDDTAFIVGHDLPFALGLTDSAGGSHDGAPLLTFKWSGTSTPTELVALDLIGAGLPPPTIDGGGLDAAWNAATPSIVTIMPMSGGGLGIGAAELRAVYDRDRVYVRVFWLDPTDTRDISKNRRIFDGVTWSKAGARDEDRVYLMWCLTEALGTASPGQAAGTTTPFRTVGCAMACHGDGVMRTDSGLLDTWHWKGARTNGLAYTDDKYMTGAASGVSGRKSDFGRSAYSDNGTENAPAFRAYSGPGANLPYIVQRPLSNCQRALALTPPANRPPFANAGPAQTVGAAELVALDGSSSFDPDGDPITFSWSQTSGTAVTLAGANTASPTFLSPASDTTLVFQLIVSDGQLQDTDTVTITVQVVAPTVSYATQVHPIWTSRTCTVCHSGASPSGGMDLGGNAAATYAQVTPGRVSLGTPAASMILTRPLDPAAGGVGHGGGTIFNDTTDPSYQLILTWIQQGAQNN